MESDSTLRRCARCKDLKDPSEFNKQTKGPDGLQRECRSCQKARYAANREADNARSRAYYAENRERLRMQQAAYRVENRERLLAQQRTSRRENSEQQKPQRRAYYLKHKARILAQQEVYRKANRVRKAQVDRAWREANPDRVRAAQAAYRERNIETVRANAAAYVKRHPDRVRVHTHARRARKLAASIGVVTAATTALRAQMFGSRCWLCGGPYEHVDHVKPLARGGPHMLANLRPACKACNHSKSAKWSGPHAAHAATFRRRIPNLP